LAKDLVSETFYKAFIASSLPKGSFKYWILQVLKNHFIDLKRKNHEILTMDYYDGSLPDMLYKGPVKSFLQKERDQRLYQHLIRLEPGTRWSENQPMHLVGFNPNLNDEASSNRRPDPEIYPLFNLMDMRDVPIRSEEDFAEAFRTHFRSRLAYLRNREEFVEIFDYNSYKIDFYDDALEYIDEYGVETYGVLVFGTAEEFLEHIDEIPYDTLHINKILPTRPNIYYR